MDLPPGRINDALTLKNMTHETNREDVKRWFSVRLCVESKTIYKGEFHEYSTYRRNP